MNYDFGSQKAAAKACKQAEALNASSNPAPRGKLCDFLTDDDGQLYVRPLNFEHRIFGYHKEDGEWRVFWFKQLPTGGIPPVTYITVDSLPTLQ